MGTSLASPPAYARLDEPDEPFLRPPTREYIDNFVSQQQRAVRATPDSEADAVRLRRAAPAARAAPVRLFDSGSAEPEDMAEYFGLLASRDDLAAKEATLRGKARIVRALSAVQLGCALIASFLLLGSSTPGWEAKALLGTAVLTAASGGAGLVGAVFRSRGALQAFFIAQMWALSLVLAQWLRQAQQRARQRTFCGDRSGAGRLCIGGLDGSEVLSIAVALGVVYVGMFYADALSEGLQDDARQADNQAIVRFTWMMNRKTLLGINRFEDVIHAKFEELVGMGYLRPKAADAGSPRVARSLGSPDDAARSSASGNGGLWPAGRGEY